MIGYLMHLIKAIAVPAMLYGIPLCMVIAGLSWIIHWIRRNRKLTFVLAEVTGHEIGQDSDGPVYRSCFEFDANDTHWKIVDECGFGWRAHTVGQKVWLGYADSDPSKAHILRFWPLVMVAIVVVIGIVTPFFATARV